MAMLSIFRLIVTLVIDLFGLQRQLEADNLLLRHLLNTAVSVPRIGAAGPRAAPRRVAQGGMQWKRSRRRARDAGIGFGPAERARTRPAQPSSKCSGRRTVPRA
jgi:hypothetical protein